jgi:predicted dienelactone hydrolase
MKISDFSQRKVLMETGSNSANVPAGICSMHAGTERAMLKPSESWKDLFFNRMRRFFVVVLLSLLVATTALISSAQARVGGHSFRIVDFDWIDATRSRSVPARLHWPTDIAAGARVPLIVFSHGIGGSRQGYSYLGRYWATRGIASLHVQHVGSDSSLWFGNPLTLIKRLQLAAHESEALARGLDVRFALNRVLSNDVGPYGDQIDRQRIVVAGHSYGANTALVAVGAGVMRAGKWLEARDNRFSAAILISSPPFYGEPDLASVLSNVKVPTLHVTTTDDVIRIPGYYSPVTDRLAVYNAIATPRKVLAVFQGGSHSIFTDRTATGGWALNPKVKAATAELALAFLDLVFDGDRHPMTSWNAKWQPIVALRPGASPLLISVARSQSVVQDTKARPAVSPCGPWRCTSH